MVKMVPVWKGVQFFLISFFLVKTPIAFNKTAVKDWQHKGKIQQASKVNISKKCWAALAIGDANQHCLKRLENGSIGKDLLYKYGKLSLNPQHLWKKLGGAECQH